MELCNNSYNEKNKLCSNKSHTFFKLITIEQPSSSRKYRVNSRLNPGKNYKNLIKLIPRSDHV